ncbi:alpha/beta hydrolase family protein [Nocardia farcinica]|uniref:alpha/beta hydrolase family protein n=1 Tax=Nocardia farcinica TaxID=37329 RepID=UPI0010C9FB9A|nr:prolyl oligopeptidase family serine peptidase [Nocardia farcinica]
MDDSALLPADLDRHGTTSHEVYTAGFYDGPWDFSVRSLLGKVFRGGADVGEVLATIATVAPGDRDGWFASWIALGERVAGLATAAADRGHHVSAAHAHLRAANYFGTALNAIDGIDGDTARLLPTFRAHRRSWDGFVASTRWPVERLDIPYEDTTLPGWLFRPDTSDTRRPALVVNNGSDGTLSGCWCEAAEAALERGYLVLMFDGPGQQSMLFERNVPFRPDWERVLTPVVDVLVSRADVDGSRLALYGVSQAGYWVPRALAFEHRFAAAVADGGVVDVARSWFEHLPEPLRQLYRSGDRTRFDETMTAAMASPEAKAAREIWAFRARPYGATGYSAVLDAVSQYTVREVADRITTPLYITDPDGEQFFPGQPAELAALVPGATLARFTQDEGASYHCQPMARALTEQRMFDWLDERLSPR